MTKRWGPNCTSDLSKTKRDAAKEERRRGIAAIRDALRSDTARERSNSQEPIPNETGQDRPENG